MIAYSKEELLILGGYSAGGTKVDNKYERSIYKLKCFSGTVYRLDSDFSDFGLISDMTFWHRHFIMGTFWDKDITAQEHFGMGIFLHHGLFGTRTLQHWDISAHGCFNTSIFWHHANQYTIHAPS